MTDWKPMLAERLRALGVGEWADVRPGKYALLPSALWPALVAVVEAAERKMPSANSLPADARLRDTLAALARALEDGK